MDYDELEELNLSEDVIDLSDIDFSKVTTMNKMFNENSIVNLDNFKISDKLQHELNELKLARYHLDNYEASKFSIKGLNEKDKAMEIISLMGDPYSQKIMLDKLKTIDKTRNESIFIFISTLIIVLIYLANKTLQKSSTIHWD